MELRFDDFIRERRYLKNVSPRTIDWYNDCFSAWRKYSAGDPKQFVIAMRQAGVKPVSCNTFICGMNAYFRWEGVAIKIPYLKEEENILPTFSAEHVRRLTQWKGKGVNLNRVHTLALLIVDTGLRIEEALTLETAKVDLDNLVVRVRGKGGKERIVPFSYELRRVLYRHLAQHGFALLFCTRNGTRMSHRNASRPPSSLQPSPSSPSSP